MLLIIKYYIFEGILLFSYCVVFLVASVLYMYDILK